MTTTVAFGGERGRLLGCEASQPVSRRSMLLPGPRGTLAGMVDGAVDPVAERRRWDAVEALDMTIVDQSPVDRHWEERRFPAGAEAVRYAEAVVDLGYWRYRVEHAAAGPELAATLAERPDELSPGVGRGDVVYDDIPVSGGHTVRVLARGQDAAGGVCTAETPPAATGAVTGGAGFVSTAPACDEQWPQAVLTSIAARQRLISHLQAEEYRDVAELAATYPGSEEFLATELALALHTSDAEGSALLGTAEALHGTLPATLAALAAGRIDDAKASAVVAATANCSTEVARQVEREVLPGAEAVTATTVRRRAGRAVIRIDPDGAAERHRSARRDRYVARSADRCAEGMGHLHVYAPAEDIATIWQALCATADTLRYPGDERGAGARRADALAMIARDILRAGGWENLRLPDRGRGRPHITVTVPYTVLLGGRAPCELDGHGPIPAEQALALVGDGDLYRLLTDPTSGQLLDYDRTRYRPPPHLAEFVRRRDGECPMPSCHQPAGGGEIDHIVPARPDPVTGRPTRGPTNAANLAAPCKHHHRAKDANRGFTLTRGDDGTYTWRTPLGRTYTWAPDREPLPEPCLLRDFDDAADGHDAARDGQEAGSDRNGPTHDPHGPNGLSYERHTAPAAHGGRPRPSEPPPF